ncbi:antibiotic biosynthesis monooxygenase [Virgibacillus profundi]|uniref:Antibiotic biosynthesis monooxygenase n=1 Tax=Virgibacillus profundi TaxID=2024555 RepID=A0A2A2IDT0_9BACI|nr:antibiotic biosynthesis monooxygenase [Virgibacillus profundi]PAV29280.1 antibiotic biosynthesis monooxygenase [Virgibacillus profundi]PXY53449.1 antibiotic biosynthesis monooxygenase [Virgibacillus profundi]
MKAYMTNGTVDFLEKLDEKYTDINFHLMTSNSGALAYYENDEKNVFSSGRAYEIIIRKGTIQEVGYVIMNNIPVTGDGRVPFEDRFKQRQNEVDMMPGFQAFRLLKPLKGNTYVVFTQWASVADFENWKNSDQFKKSHKGQTTKPPAYAADKPFITEYHMLNKDD